MATSTKTAKLTLSTSDGTEFGPSTSGSYPEYCECSLNLSIPSNATDTGNLIIDLKDCLSGAYNTSYTVDVKLVVQIKSGDTWISVDCDPVVLTGYSNRASYPVSFTVKFNGYAAQFKTGISGLRITAKNESGYASIIRCNTPSSDMSVSIDYTTPDATAITWPDDAVLSVSGAYSTGTTTLTWSGPVDGTDNTVAGFTVQYSDNDGDWTDLTTDIAAANRSYSASVSETAGVVRKFRIKARGSAGSAYDSTYLVSSGVTRISLSAPTVSDPVSPANTCVLSWTASTISGATGTVTYKIYTNGTERASVTELTYTISESVLKTLTSPVSIYVNAVFSVATAKSNTVSFTYQALSGVKVRTSNDWIICPVYARIGNEWKECDLYYYNGTEFVRLTVE